MSDKICQFKVQSFIAESKTKNVSSYSLPLLLAVEIILCKATATADFRLSLAAVYQYSNKLMISASQDLSLLFSLLLVGSREENLKPLINVTDPLALACYLILFSYLLFFFSSSSFYSES